MKRRNVECGKPRRPLKRSKISEGFYGSTFLYLKFLLVWALVLMADFILEFRFEYLWPFWLMLRSVYDSFKYQGLKTEMGPFGSLRTKTRGVHTSSGSKPSKSSSSSSPSPIRTIKCISRCLSFSINCVMSQQAFSAFFVCVAITSDVVCYLFVPVQWLFFAASTYVWVQYVWHTERGICLPTVSLWLLFVYIEASVRLRELKNLPFNLDLCRPFAAHCIGYPVVTLGFGFKTYVSYKLRLRKQRDVQKENDFYFHLVQQALPPELQHSEKQKALMSKAEEEVISNGTVPSKKSSSSKCPEEDNKDSKKSISKSTTDDNEDEEIEFIEQSLPKKTDVNSFDETAENLINESQAKSSKANGITGKVATVRLNTSKENTSKKGKNYSKDITSTAFSNNKDEFISRLESDVKKLKADLQLSRNSEQELRSQLTGFVVNEKSMRSEIYQLQQDNDNLQNKLHNLVTSRQQDKQNLSIIEKKLQEERKNRNIIEQQLATERKAKKAEEVAAARAVAMAAAVRGECSESCKNRRRDIENDMKMLTRDLQQREDQFRQLEREVQSLRQFKDAQNETEVLMSALSAMQDKNAHLENNLSAETRLKLDLFSALGEAKRQIEIFQTAINRRDEEIADLKSRMSEVMALMPATSTMNGMNSPTTSSPLYSHKGHVNNDMIIKSTLNPHASDYTPKAM